MSVEFLTAGWVAALDAVAQATPPLASIADAPLYLQHEVIDPRGGATRYHLRIGGGAAAVAMGEPPDGSLVVRIHQDRATAAAIASGRLSAQRAFMTGRLRIGGDLSVLIEHADALALLDDVFAGVRDQTVMPPDLVAGTVAADPAGTEGTGA